MRLRAISRLAAVLAIAGVVSPGAAAGASIGGFSARPAHFNVAVPATRAYFIRTVRRGAGFKDQVIVVNSAAAPVTLWVSAVDGLTGVTSGAVYGDRGDTLRDAGLWVKPAVAKISVPARSRVSVPFSVRVPRTASPGDHLAGLALQNAQPRRTRGRFSITEIVRTVVGVEIKVPGPAQPQIALRHLSLAPLPGTSDPSLVVSLTSVGRRLCKPRLAVELSGPGGAQRAARQLDTILPGDSIPYPFAWPRALASGSYRAIVNATGCGPRAVLHASVRLGRNLARTGIQSAAVSQASASSGGGWWPMVLVGLGGLAAGALITRGRRAVRRRP
jgi:hypothetical protein